MTVRPCNPSTARQLIELAGFSILAGLVVVNLVPSLSIGLIANRG
jgi:hypothetical protein